MAQLTQEQLIAAMQASAGDDDVELDGPVLDTLFYDLGFGSLAILQTAGRLARQFDVLLDQDELADAQTPRALLELVNSCITPIAV